MRETKRVALPVLEILLMLTILGGRKADAQDLPVLIGFYCVPSTCLTIDPNVGYFHVSMIMSGTFTFVDQRATRIINKTIVSNGCTLETTLEAYGDTVSSDIFGAGILVNVSGSQGTPPVQLIMAQTIRYMFRGSTLVTPSPAVPCV